MIIDADDDDENNMWILFSCPFITFQHQFWLGEFSFPNQRNSNLPKRRYRQYWNMFSNVRVWFLLNYVITKAKNIEPTKI